MWVGKISCQVSGAWYFNEVALLKWGLSSLPHPDNIAIWLKDCWKRRKSRIKQTKCSTCSLAAGPKRIIYIIMMYGGGFTAATWHLIPHGLRSDNRNIRVTHKIKANFPFSCDNFRRSLANIPKLFSSCLLAQPSAAYANRIYVCLFVTKNMRTFSALVLFIWFCIKLIINDIIYSI